MTGSLSAASAEALLMGDPRAVPRELQLLPPGQMPRRRKGCILDDKIRHVAMGAKHFAQMAQSRGESYGNYWEMLVRQPLHGALKPPFNDSARQAAGLPRSVHLALA